ncbi:MAG: transposase family protein [Ktedonobacteraceae bacterium]|nr:transposase family protein [Ktedonobacteraceae bacterium]
MEAVYYAARANLRRLMILHPTWTRSQFAQATGMSRSWVDKWKKRLLNAPKDDEQVLQGLSRAPHHPPPRLDQQVVDRVLEIRDDPPEDLRRTPGPRALLYYLNRDETFKEGKLRLPKSTRTIYRILKENGRIASRLPIVTEPTERPAPMQHWQLDFKDASSVPTDAHGKKQHVVEILNIIDKGTSVLVAHHVRSDFSAETALAAVAQTFAEHGLPTSITLDRDTRWAGAPQGSDFPAALVRFCHALGVAVLLCDPHHPQQNGFVERYHRTLNQECLKRERPKTIDEVHQVTEAFASHYNWQRPHQGISCGNRPPRVAFPTLPSLPKVPDLVNPDAWLSQVKGQHLVRRVNRQGFVKVDLSPYYISSKLAGQKVTLSIQAREQSLQVVYPQEYRRSLPLKGLHQRALPYQEYLALMQREASTQQRLLSLGRWKIRSD